MNRHKITLIGGGQIGGNLALLAAQKELGDIVIYDIPNAEGMIKGKALDISQLTPLDGYDVNISGSSNPEDLKDSDVIIITAGVPRKPGMNREDLLDINVKIILPENNIKFHQMMKKGDLIAKIINYRGENIAKLLAPEDGMIFGLRALPNVTTGDWCCFYAIIEGTWDD